jgi:hypothetical protein
LGFVGEEFDAASIEYLESNEMKMDGVGVVRQVNQIPDFHRVQDWIFRDRHIPMSADEQHRDGVLDRSSISTSGSMRVFVVSDSGILGTGRSVDGSELVSLQTLLILSQSHDPSLSGTLHCGGFARTPVQ